MSDENINVEDILVNLKIIAKIKQDEKMTIQNNILVVDTRFAQPLFRWYTANNRTDTLNFISTIVNQAIDSIQNSTVNHSIFDESILKQELTNALIGLDNLSATYKLDNLIKSRIELLQTKIKQSCGS